MMTPNTILMSAFGTFRTSRDVRHESGIRTKADVDRSLQFPWLLAYCAAFSGQPAPPRLICPSGCWPLFHADSKKFSIPSLPKSNPYRRRAAAANLHFGISELPLDDLVEAAIETDHPVPTEGRFAIVTDVGRGAVDAGGAFDEWR